MTERRPRERSSDVGRRSARGRETNRDSSGTARPSAAASMSTRFGAPISPAAGPAASDPTKAPAIAAAVSNGNTRFACLASKLAPATVQ